MDDWAPATLEELIEVRHGFAFKGEFFRADPPGDFLLTPGNFAIGGGFQWGKRKFYRGPVPDDYVLEPGDIVVTMTDLSKEADTLGYSAVVPESEYRLLHNQRLGRIVIKSKKTTKSFIHWLLRSPDYRDEILANYTGSTVKHTSPSKITAFKFLLPPLSDQVEISHILDSLETKIDLNRRINETLEAMARAIFKSRFVDFDSVRAKAEGRQPAHMPPETAALFPACLDEEGKPEGWEYRPLDGIAEFLNGIALQKFPADDEDDYLPVIKIAELRQGVTAKTSKASLAVPEKYVIEDGDILFSWSGSLTQRIWTDGRGALNQHLFKVSSVDFPKWFFYFWVDHHLPNFQAIAASKATTMGHIQRHHLTEAICVVPDGDTLEAASGVISPLFERMIHNDLETKTLAQLRDLLLPKLMSGEVRVRDL